MVPSTTLRPSTTKGYPWNMECFSSTMCVMERKFNFSTDEYYHIYARGVEKRIIFVDQYDYSRFIKLLYIANSHKPFEYKLIGGLPLEKIKREKIIVSIGAYCLMPNHFHLLIREKDESGISKFMLKLMTAYSMYFNKKYNRTGRLFQNTFQAKHADNDEYLRYLFSYIHLNPLKLVDENWYKQNEKKLKIQREFLQNYYLSSYLDFVGINREEKIILNKENFPDYFSTEREFSDFINDWLEMRDMGIESIQG